jgi:hypothetical protein
VKKYLALVLGLVFVFGFAVSAFALPAEIPSETQAVVAKGSTQITLGGELRMRGWYVDNISGTRRAISNPADTDSQAWWDGRVRLSLRAEVTKNTSGFVHLETGSTTGDSYTWGTLNTKQGGPTQLLEAWILHKGSGLLGVPAGIKVGHMPLALGEMQFLDHRKFGDDALVLFVDPTKELHIGLLTAKFAEGSTGTDSAADIDGYVGLFTYKLDKDNTLGMNYAYVNAPNPDLKFSNLGIHANGKLATVLSYKTELDLQFGEVGTVDYDGYGFLLGLGYKFDPTPLVIRGEFAIGSGDSRGTGDGDNKEFQTTLGNDVHYTFVYEFTTRGAAQYQTVDTGRGGRSTGIANTTYFRLGIDADIAKDLKGSLDGFILRATKVASGSKKIGSEFDLKLTYKIDRNLTYSFTAGYLDTGKWWEDTLGVASSQNKNITQAMHALTLSF